MQALLDCSCGIDIHRDILEVCVVKGVGDYPEILRSQFKTTPDGLGQLTAWLKAQSCVHIAMESTGVYWRPVYETLEKDLPEYKILMVVNARHMRNLPGRKSDVKDAEWIATLLRYGLLEASFVPDRIVRTLREYSRTYKAEVQEKSRLLNRIEKFLQSHGFKISSVISKITGTSGRNLLGLLAEKGCIRIDDVRSAIHKRIRRPIEEIQSAVCGELEVYEQKLLKRFLDKLCSCEENIAGLLADMLEMATPYRAALESMDSIPGIDLTAALMILAEIGPTPMTAFKTAGHLCSWAGLSPRNDESAGKVKSKKILHGNPYVKSILCQVAWATTRCRNSSLARWFWANCGRLGKKKAIIALSRKILSLVYILLQKGEHFINDLPTQRPPLLAP